MRFGSSISRIWSALAAMFSTAPAMRRSSIKARSAMRELALANPVKSGRLKTSGPNWLKIALNSRR